MRGIIFLILMLITGVVFGTASQQTPVHHSTTSNQSADNNKKGTESSPLVVKILPPVKTKEDSEQEEQNRKDVSSANWWMVRLTGVVGFIGLLQLLVFGYQAFKLRETVSAAAEQIEYMKKSVTETGRSASAMEDVSKQVAISAVAGTKSVAALEKFSKAQSRAYLTVIIGGGSYQDRDRGIRFGVAPTLINTGHTPAYKVRFRATAQVLDAQLPDGFGFPLRNDWHGSGVLGPQQNFIISANIEGLLPDDQVQEIMIGAVGRRLFIWGEVTYEDVYGTPHITRFCHSIHWVPDANRPGNHIIGGLYTDRHNDAD